MAGPNAVQFDGSTWLSKSGGLTGAADSKNILGSLWFRANTASTSYLMDNTSTRAAVYFFGSLYFLFRSTGGADSFFGIRSSTYRTDDTWHHLCFSTNGTSGKCYFDDVSFPPSALLNNTLDLAAPNYAIGSALGGGAKYTGAMAQLYLSFGTYLDLSIASNRRKLVGPGATSSVDMGSDGSNVTGSPPILFFDGDTSNWHTNKGSGGGFSKSGTLTTASLLPPDYYVPPPLPDGGAIIMGL